MWKGSEGEGGLVGTTKGCPTGKYRTVRRTKIPRHLQLQKEILSVKIQTYRMVWTKFV